MKLIKYIQKQIALGITLGGGLDGLLQIGLWFMFSFYMLSLAALEVVYAKVFINIFGWIITIGLLLLILGISAFYYQTAIKSWREWKEIRKR